MAGDEEYDRELPGVDEVGRSIAAKIRERPWTALSIALFSGYLLGGGLFTRSTGWLARATLATLAVPEIRERALGAWRGREPSATTSRQPAASAAPA